MTLRQDLEVRQGQTWSFVWTKKDAAGVAVNLTGYSARMAIRDRIGGVLQAYLTTGADADGGSIALGGAAGTVTLALTALQSASLADYLTRASILYTRNFFVQRKPLVHFLYDLELVSGAGVVTRELEGSVLVYREVTT
jgi:hypothetical protein